MAFIAVTNAHGPSPIRLSYHCNLLNNPILCWDLRKKLAVKLFWKGSSCSTPMAWRVSLGFSKNVLYRDDMNYMTMPEMNHVSWICPASLPLQGDFRISVQTSFRHWSSPTASSVRIWLQHWDQLFRAVKRYLSLVITSEFSHINIAVT